MKKILRIDLSSQSYRYEEVRDGYANLGGRGLSSMIVGEEVPPLADPLGPENRLVFAPGILAGTTVPNSARLSVGAKSPLTNTIKEANAGGAAAQKLAGLGIHAVIVEGASKEPVTAKITLNGVSLIPADDLKCMGNYAFEPITAPRPPLAAMRILKSGDVTAAPAALSFDSPAGPIDMTATLSPNLFRNSSITAL